MGKGGALAEDPDPFLALVDLGRHGEPPRVWVLPSAEVRGHVASPGEPRSWRYRPSAEELSSHEDGWDAIERRLLDLRAPRTGWFNREELEEHYGEEFVEALAAEASRLLGVENSTLRRIADERFCAEDLADASALLSVLFRRWMEQKRWRR